MIQLFHNDKSTCSQKVRLCLAELGLEWVNRHIDLATQENLTADYLKINPNGVVPALKHDGNVITESTVICEYLCEAFPDPDHLLPASAVDRAHVRAWLRYIDEVPSMAVRVPTFELIREARFGKMNKAGFEEFTRRNPLRRDFFERLGTGGFSQEDQVSADKQLIQTVERFEAAMANSDWISGEYSIADICAASIFQRLDDIGQAQYWANAPKVSAWFERLRSRPTWEVAFYPGSLMGDEVLSRR